MKRIKVGSCESVHYCSPGRMLNDLELKQMHNSLVYINKMSGSNVDNKLLHENLSMRDIRKYYTKMIVGLFYYEQEVIGFLLSPILKVEEQYMVHGGLVIIAKNPGVNVLILLSFGNSMLAYEKLGKHYVTNISSTPSIIENFTKLFPGCWPNPNVDLKKAPNKYINAVKILKHEYMDRFFPDSSKLEVDYKRFTLKSNSQEMGFVTDFFQISRSSDISFQNFCRTWIDYSKEEDIIQVGETKLLNYLRMQLYLVYFKMHLKKSLNKMKKRREIQNIQPNTDEILSDYDNEDLKAS